MFLATEEQRKTKTIYDAYGKGNIKLNSYVLGSTIYVTGWYEDKVRRTDGTTNGFLIEPSVQKKVGSSWQTVETRRGADFWATRPSPVKIGFYNYGRYGNSLRITAKITPARIRTNGTIAWQGPSTYYNMSAFTM